MRYSDDRYHLRIEFETKQCEIPREELVRMQQLIAPVGEEVRDFPASELALRIIHHRRSDQYHVESRLRLPGRTLFTGDQDVYLDSAFQRCMGKLVQKVQAYKEHPNARAEAVAGRRTALERDMVAPEDPGAGPLGHAVRAGDYRAFRRALSGYEEWLRKRVGRWIQRYPKAEAQIGSGLKLGDLVEEVYLNAFERYAQRPTEVPLNGWLESLIDPSLKMLLRHPEEESENASMVRTLGDNPLR
jgi:hypothetical protein